MSSKEAFGRQELIERLREYLSDLSGDSHRTLSRSIDRARARGEESPIHSIIMDALRNVMENDENGNGRALSAERAFFESLNPILSRIALPDKQVGIIDRASLRPIWIWITRDLVPGRCDSALAALRAAIVDENVDTISSCVDAFQQEVRQHTLAVMAETDKKHGSLKRLEGQLGTSRVLADLHDMLAFFEQKTTLEAFLKRLPKKLPVGQNGLNALGKALAVYKDKPASQTVYAFNAIHDRLGSPSDLVRFALQYAGSSDPADIRASHAGTAVQLALSYTAMEVERLRLALASERNLDTVLMHLRKYHELVSSLSRTLEDSPNDPWHKRLSTIRGLASELLSKELEPLAHLVKRSVITIESGGREIVPDKTGVDEAVFGLTLLMSARQTRSALAINSLIERLEKTIEDILESQGKPAIDRLSMADDENWDAAVARSEAAVRFFGIYFGGNYGASMARRHAAIVESRTLERAS